MMEPISGTTEPDPLRDAVLGVEGDTDIVLMSFEDVSRDSPTMDAYMIPFLVNVPCPATNTHAVELCYDFM